MGHAVLYRSFDVKKSRQSIADEVLNVVANSGDCYGTQRIHFNESKVKSYEEAQQFLEKESRGQYYPGEAVMYYDTDHLPENKAVAALRSKYKKTLDDLQKFNEESTVRNFKAKYIGCKKCGSSLSKDFLRGDSCPLCRADLRSKTTLDRISAYQKRLEDIQKKIESEKKKQWEKASLKWMVRFEYHE